MVREVYIDLYFLINTSMNLLCLMITASLLHRRVRRLRALFAAAVGGLYAALALIFGTAGIIEFVSDISIAFLMCTITFVSSAMGFRKLLQCTLVQALTSMVLGGIMTALYSLLNQLDLPLESLQGDGLSVWSFALLTAVAGIATARGGRLFGLSGKTKSVNLIVVLFGHEVTLRAMVDSGNLLRDPVSGRSVILTDQKLILPVLPSKIANLCTSNVAFENVLTDYEIARHVRLIPIHTASGDTILPALLPDKLILTDGKSTYPADYLIAPADLGTHANGFDAVIPSE